MQQQLDEAIAARHAWRTGKTRAAAAFGDRRIEYSVEGMKQLDAYIAELRRQLAGPAARRRRVTYLAPR
ncbi:gpW family head-tail joining protein [Stenotrophomonas terrae]|uniref:gpW family head-tail joining protein n=1 Tax=Stenotrophomonas terrae TaxID=405446 RepID=UPI00320A0FF5